MQEISTSSGLNTLQEVFKKLFRLFSRTVILYRLCKLRFKKFSSEMSPLNQIRCDTLLISILVMLRSMLGTSSVRVLIMWCERECPATKTDVFSQSNFSFNLVDV